MSKKTIAKISLFVISAICGSVLLFSCSKAKSNERERPDFDRGGSPFLQPRISGRVRSNDIVESSGLASSKCQPGVFWTHNDSGDGAFIYAINAAGDDLGTWRVTGAENRDWEDIAAFRDAGGKCFLYIGEIGNNEGKRDRTVIYRIKEPSTADAAKSDRKDPLATVAAESLNVAYPAGRPNAESLLIHPVTGDVYIVTKQLEPPAVVYKVSPQFGSAEAVNAQKVGSITVPALLGGLLTGGDISPDGRHVVLCDYVAGYEITLPEGDANFDDIWLQKPVKFDLGDRKDGEAIAYSVDGNSIFATSEGKNQPIFEVRRR